MKRIAARSDYSVDQGSNERYKFAAKTDPGKVRELNEDKFLAEPELDLWLVADGMGGHSSGDVASEIACEIISKGIRSGTTLTESVRQAHTQILEQAATREDDVGMGSTVVAVRVDNVDYEVAWVGDSRAYLFDGELMQITRDHSYVQDLVNSGTLSAEDAKNHPGGHLLTQCLGVKDDPDFNVSIRHGRFSRGQEILLCSDGLTDELSDDMIKKVLASDMDIKDRVDSLIETALEHGGSDNVTVVLFSAPVGGPSRAMNSIKMLAFGACLAAIILGVAYYLTR